ncbi:MAG: SpaH/EbpB family LPXTG-anchored major pilin [Clostridia bacterium]|nr:SpaH/EbpB family LPXTG-anchored major pilin [Clostridia bacterium]
MSKVFQRISVLLVLVATVLTLGCGVSAASVEDATIDTSRKASLSIYKYDLTNAVKDGVWDESYVSTGVRDEAGVEAVLGNTNRENTLGNGQTAYGYALKGVEFTYLKVADITTYTQNENGASHVEVLYGIPAGATTNQLLSSIGLSPSARYTPADAVVDGVTVYYYRSDTLIKALSSALESNATTVKNALESYVKANGGTPMTETDSYGHTAASNLPLGLYLVMETRVPEMVTATTNPFFVSLPMTSVNGTNATDGGERWIYDVTLYPKNETGIPSLEKMVREASYDTGNHTGSESIADGYAHTASASSGDVLEYQIISTLPSITSAASYLSEYTVVDTLSKGLTYNKNDVVIEFFTDKNCTDKLTTWRQNDGTAKFTTAYGSDDDGSSIMTITMTAAGLEEINTSKQVYTDAGALRSGYSDCTMRITYAATLDSDNSVVFGDSANPNGALLRWKRTNIDYSDILIDDCHVYTYGIDLTKQFSDGAGDYTKVEFILKNETDGYFVQATLNEAEGIYYVVDNAAAADHACAEADATHFIPTADGSILIKGLEDDTYVATEVRTDNGYTLLKDDITIVISKADSFLCDCYDADLLGLIQNDDRYTAEQKHLEHMLLTASATVDGNTVTMLTDADSANAEVPLTVINTRGFDLPKTGDNGVWMYGVGGAVLMGSAMVLFLISCRKKSKSNE